MSRRAAPPAPEADPAEAWAPFDTLTRRHLPAYLESLGFLAEAGQLRALAPVACATDADALRAIARELRSSVFSESVHLAEVATALRAEGADELVVLQARRACQHARFELAPLMIGCALDVAGGFASGTALGPGPWPSPRRYAAMLLEHVGWCLARMNLPGDK